MVYIYALGAHHQCNESFGKFLKLLCMRASVVYGVYGAEGVYGACGVYGAYGVSRVWGVYEVDGVREAYGVYRDVPGGLRR